MPDIPNIAPELAALPVGLAGMYIIYRLAVSFNDKMFSLATNHMNNLAEAVRELAQSVGSLREWLKETRDRDV